MMGIPALLAYFVFQLRFHLKLGDNRVWTGIFGFLGGALGLGIAVLLAFTILITTIPGNIDVAAERSSILALTLAHVPLILIEGLFTALVVVFLQRVEPELLEAS